MKNEERCEIENEMEKKRKRKEMADRKFQIVRIYSAIRNNFLTHTFTISFEQHFWFQLESYKVVLKTNIVLTSSEPNKQIHF